jgi:hypothetical protein
MSDPSKESLAALTDSLAELSKMYDRLNRELRPVRDEERTLKDGVAATHGGPGKFNPDGAPARAPKFNRMTDISEKHGPTKAEFARVTKLMNAYMRDAAALEKALKPKGK